MREHPQHANLPIPFTEIELQNWNEKKLHRNSTCSRAFSRRIPFPFRNIQPPPVIPYPPMEIL